MRRLSKGCRKAKKCCSWSRAGRSPRSREASRGRFSISELASPPLDLMALIELRNVTKRYKIGEQEILALNGIDLTIEQGEYAAIIGPSGSGKSTLMHLLGCLDTPTTGTMMIDGVDVSRAGSNKLSEMRNQKIGFVFQS